MQLCECGARLRKITSRHRKTNGHLAQMEPKRLLALGWARINVRAYAAEQLMRAHGIPHTKVPSCARRGVDLWAPAQFATQVNLRSRGIRARCRIELESLLQLRDELHSRRQETDRAIRAEVHRIEGEVDSLISEFLSAETEGTWSKELRDSRLNLEALITESDMQSGESVL